MIDWAALFFVRTLVGLIRFLPEPAAYPICRAIVGIILLLMPRAPSVARRNLAFVFPEKSEAEREDLFKKSLRSLARNLLAYAKLPDFDPEAATQMSNMSVVAETVNRTRAENPGVGIIFGTLHYGSFELFAQFHAIFLRPARILARGFDGFPRLDNWWFARRELFGNRIFRRKGAFAEMFKSLQNNEDVVILYDQNVKRNHATFVDFFGKKAATTKAVALASIRTGAPIICGAFHEHSKNQYEVVFEAIDHRVRESETPEESLLRITTAINSAAERFIRLYPEDWMWIHRRFKTRPEGEREDFYS